MSGAWAVFVIVDIAVTYACFMKGKKLMGWIGIVGLIPPLTFVLVLVPVIGAMTPAKSGSKWARQPLQLPPPPADAWRYTPSNPDAATNTQTTATHPQTPADNFMAGGSQRSASRTGAQHPGSARPPDRSELQAFLKRAEADNVIDRSTYDVLIEYLERPDTEDKPLAAPPPAPSRAPRAPRVAQPPPTGAPPRTAAPLPPPPRPAEPAPPAPAPTKAPPRQPVPVRTAATPAAKPQPTPVPRPPAPPVPREPSAFAKKRAELWDAFTSDVAVHGLVYLGVLLTFVSVLGFMLFAFKGLPIPAKPIVGPLIVLTFFGWAWVLNHQNAPRVAKAMELLGGMILPLVWYAALVDSADFPPDAQDGSLIAALIISSLALSGIYWLVSLRFEESMLRFLVWPMVWVAAMGAGFVFKTDEALVGDAITRLVAEQSALASVAIAVSLALLMWRSESRLARPTYMAALVGIPSAYLLTFGLSLGDGVAVSWPIIVSGSATVASVELVARWYEWQAKLRPLRPYVYALIGVPLVLAIGIGWGGAIVAVSYVVLAEFAIRSPKMSLHDVASSSAGATVGLLLSLAEPGAAIVAFGTVSLWAHVRRRLAIEDRFVERTVAAVAALAPLGLLFGLSELTSTPTAILIMATAILVAAIVLRVLSRGDAFDAYWFPAASALLGIAAAVLWVVDGSSATTIVAGLVVAATTVALGQRWPTVNLWLSAALVTLATAIAIESLDVAPEAAAAAWSAMGALVILTSMLTHGLASLRIAPGHVSALGHVIGLFAFTVSTESTTLVIAMTGWAIGWALSFVGSELRGGVDPLDVWSDSGATERSTSATLEMHLDAVAPAASALTLIAAVAAVFFEVTSGVDSWPWLGAVLGTVGVSYAAATRWLIRSRNGRVVFGWTSAIIAVAGVVLSSVEPWAVIAASAAVVAIRVILHGVLSVDWLTWVTWLTPAVALTALAYELGLSDESLALVPLTTGIAMLLAALALDEATTGVRIKGQFIRTPWLVHPAWIGGALIPASVIVLYLSASPAAAWAASAAALAYTAASTMLRRSVWITATLASIALGMGLHAADVPAVGSAVTWGTIGIALLVSAVGLRRLPQDDIAGIGHAVGAVGLGYVVDETVLLIAMSTWAIGWMIGVATSELGGPSVARVLERSSRWWDESYGTWSAAAAQGLAPAAAVATSTTAVIVAWDHFATFTDAGAWSGAVVGVLGLVFSVAGGHLLRTRISSMVFGWGGLAVSALAIGLALPENLPIAVATTLFIGARVAVRHLIPDPWLTWVTWLMPTAAVMAIASEMGVPYDSITVIPIVTGGVMLLGGLLADEVINGSRRPKEFVRSGWLSAPTILGASFMLVGLALLRDAATTDQLWAGAGVALTYAVASLLLRRSIWLTSTLGAVGLALALEAAGASQVEAAIVWAALGIGILALVPFTRGLPQAQVAAIGHLFGAGAFAYAADENAYLVALTGWTVGWVGAVVATETGWPSISQVFDSAGWHARNEGRSRIDRLMSALPAVLTVGTSTLLALTAYARFITHPDEAPIAVVLALLGLVFAVSARFIVSSEPSPSVFGWSGVAIAGAAVVSSMGSDLQIIFTASVFLVIRLLMVGQIPQTWLSWPAWLVPPLIVVASGHAVGVPNRSLYLLSLASGVVMLVGSLVSDDLLNSRRAIGEGLRTAWLRYPFVIGLLLVPLSIAPVFALDATTVGVTSIAAALGYLVVAILLRSGSVSAPALGLAAVGVAFLWPRSAVDEPWILVVMAAAMTAWSFVAERLQSDGSSSSVWTRWDLPALVVAHLTTAAALLLTLDGSPEPATWIAAGALSMIIGVQRHNRWWIDAGLLLIIVGSAFAVDPWLFVALILAAARGMYGVRQDEGVARTVDHAIAVTAFTLAWVDLALMTNWTYLQVVSYGALTAAMATFVVGILSWRSLAKKDTFALWSGVGVAGVIAAAVAAFNAEPVAVDGPWLAIAIALIAAVSEQWARVFHANIRYGTPIIAAAAWVVLLVGIDSTDITSATATVSAFGFVLAMSVLVADRAVSATGSNDAQQWIDTERVWAVVTLTGIVASIAVAVRSDTPGLWWACALGLILTTVAVATGSRAVGISRLRIATGIPALGAITAVTMALEVSAFGIGVSMIIASAVATLATVWFASRHRESDWVETLLVSGVAAIAIAAPIAAGQLPRTELVAVILVAVGAQAIAYGIVFGRQSLVALGPPALGLATIIVVSESARGSALWYTVPIAVVMLAEADILHRIGAQDEGEPRSVALLILEWSGVALLGLPAIVEMFTTNVAFGLVGFGFALALLVWALLTRVKRRVLAACVVATLSVMLTLAAAAASNVQDSAAFWIVGGGIGFSIMLIAGFVEAYRSRSGALMRRLGDLMEGWE